MVPLVESVDGARRRRHVRRQPLPPRALAGDRRRAVSRRRGSERSTSSWRRSFPTVRGRSRGVPRVVSMAVTELRGSGPSTNDAATAGPDRGAARRRDGPRHSGVPRGGATRRRLAARGTARRTASRWAQQYDRAGQPGAGTALRARQRRDVGVARDARRADLPRARDRRRADTVAPSRRPSMARRVRDRARLLGAALRASTTTRRSSSIARAAASRPPPRRGRRISGRATSACPASSRRSVSASTAGASRPRVRPGASRAIRARVPGRPQPRTRRSPRTLAGASCGRRCCCSVSRPRRSPCAPTRCGRTDARRVGGESARPPPAV